VQSKPSSTGPLHFFYRYVWGYRMSRYVLARLLLFYASGLFLINTASAASIIQVSILSSTTIRVSLSGTIIGPVPAQTFGILFIDVPVSSSVDALAFGGFGSIIGDARLGANSINTAASGYNNGPYGGSLQLRNSENGIIPFAIGDVLSGSDVITFNNPHGLTQSMFDGVGAPIYWARNFDLVGTLEGYAVSYPVSSVPLPATLPLFATGLGGLGLLGWRRKRKAAALAA
jgi:hypothetical protein